MTRRSQFLLLLLAAGLGSTLLWWWMREDDAQAARKTLLSIARWSSYRAEESPLAKQYAIRQLKPLFSPSVRLQLNLQGHRPYLVEGRDSLMEGIQQVRFGVAQLKLEFLDLKLSHTPGTTRVEIYTTLSARIGVEQQQEYLELKGHLENSPEGWQVARLETVKTWGR